VNIGGYKAIEHALNFGDSNSLCLEVILVHMPFVLKSSIVDEILVDKNNLPLYVCYETRCGTFGTSYSMKNIKQVCGQVLATYIGHGG